MDFPEHLLDRMSRRGVSPAEIEDALRLGWPCSDARHGTHCRVYVFDYNDDWAGKHYAEKEVTLYFKYDDAGLVLVTAKTRYGSSFPRGDDS